MSCHQAFFFLQGKAQKEIQAIMIETLKYDIKGTSAQQYLLSHSNSVSDCMFQPTKWS